MSESLITKKALAASIKALMEQTALEKITIKDIVEHCGLNRQTFYYHFRDKYELVNWIYRTEGLESIADYRDYQHWTIGIKRIYTHLHANRSFYINAVNTLEQNTFNDYLFEATQQLVAGVADELSRDIRVSAADRTFIADFYAFAFVGLTTRWVKTGMKESVEDMTERISDIVEGSMQRALAKYAEAPIGRLRRKL